MGRRKHERNLTTKIEHLDATLEKSGKKIRTKTNLHVPVDLQVLLFLCP